MTIRTGLRCLDSPDSTVTKPSRPAYTVTGKSIVTDDRQIRQNCYHKTSFFEPRLPLTIEQQRLLTEYASASRYPGSYEPIPLAEAKEAVKLSRRVKKEIRRLLEKKPLF